MSGVFFGLQGKSNVTMTKSHFKQHLISSISHSVPFKCKISSPYPGLLTVVFMFALNVSLFKCPHRLVLLKMSWDNGTLKNVWLSVISRRRLALFGSFRPVTSLSMLFVFLLITLHTRRGKTFLPWVCSVLCLLASNQPIRCVFSNHDKTVIIHQNCLQWFL